MTIDDRKRAAAEAAVAAEVSSGMRIGLGTGSTAAHVLDALARRLAAGELERIAGVPTSEATARAAEELGVPLLTLGDAPDLDVAIDGADEVDRRIDVVKGMGGALLREKIVAFAARRFVVVVDDSKRVGRLGERTPVPVEVIRFAEPVCQRALEALGCRARLRIDSRGSAFETDEGNVILDCTFEGGVPDPPAVAAAIHAIPGVVEHGLFLGMSAAAYIAGEGGVVVHERPA
jgi:ribose 5-phosphate isomerase A